MGHSVTEKNANAPNNFFVRFTIPMVAASKFLGRLLLKAFPEAKQKAYKSHTVNVKQVHLNRWEKAKEFSC